MSVSLQSTSVNTSLNGYSYYIRTLCDNSENIFQNSANFSHCEGFRIMHQFPSFSTISRYSDYLRITNGNTDWLNQVCAETDKHIFEYQKINFNTHGKELKSENTYNQESEEKRVTHSGSSKIWRPFSPSPPFQVDNTMENSVPKRNSRTTNNNLFHSIKPSTVKIGHSKTSVFKAVKKNTFSCDQCSSRYISNRQLNTHMRVHTGSKPFRCEYPNCFKSFARNEELTRHKRIHSGFKPHLCNICKKRFGRKDHLSKHLKTHLQTSEKKIYQCSFPGCGHRYTRSDALTRHKSTAHVIKSHQ